MIVRRYHIYFTFSFLLFCLFFARCDKFHFQRSEPGGVYGIVIDQKSGRPIAGAEVILTIPSFKTVTNDSGYYELLDIEQKEYTIFYIYPEYDTVQVEAIEMKKGEKYQIDVALVPRSSKSSF
ncbi:carboxypeptidase-like regulatory domain-containing protein [bacterium]|nr:carboxypeptidase-like regulatory domain-containing protein [bacterium]